MPPIGHLDWIGLDLASHAGDLFATAGVLVMRTSHRCRIKFCLSIRLVPPIFSNHESLAVF